METKIKFPARAVAAVAAFQSTEDTRYYLNGVYFEPASGNRGARITATDGHRLARFTTSADDNDAQVSTAAIVPVPKCLYPVLKKKTAATYVWDGERAEVFNDVGALLGAAATKAIDGTFPDVDRVIPAEPDKFGPAAFNSKYVKSFCDAATVFQDGPRETRTILIQTSGPNDPARVTLPDTPEFIGVLMPIRI